MLSHPSNILTFEEIINASSRTIRLNVLSLNHPSSSITIITTKHCLYPSISISIYCSSLVSCIHMFMTTAHPIVSSPCKELCKQSISIIY